MMPQEPICKVQVRRIAGAVDHEINRRAELQAPKDIRNKPSMSSTSEMLLSERTRRTCRSRCTRSHQLMTEKCRGDKLCTHSQGNSSRRAIWCRMIGTTHLLVHKYQSMSESQNALAELEGAKTSKHPLRDTILIQI
jgi:hypothetical protein